MKIYLRYMSKIKNVINAVFVALSLLLIISSSCTPESICLSNQNALQAGFYSAYSSSDKDTILGNFSIIGIGENDSVYSKEVIQKLFLPLSFSNDCTLFLLENNTIKDTLWIAHKKEFHYISRKCGYAFNFAIDTVWSTSAFIDSIGLDVKSVRYNENVENVKIFIY